MDTVRYQKRLRLSASPTGESDHPWNVSPNPPSDRLISSTLAVSKHPDKVLAKTMAPHDRTHVQGCSMLALPNESLFEIASYIPEDPRQLKSFMMVCRRTCEIGEYIRYTSLTIRGADKSGRHLLAMLQSGSTISIKYCKLVKRLWYSGAPDEYSMLSNQLLSSILPQLTNLRTLVVDARRIDTEHLLKRLSLSGIMRRSVHPALSITKIWNMKGDFTVVTLPSLKYLKLISRESSLWSLGSYRALTELDLDFSMDIDTLADFLSTAESSVLSSTLRILGIRFPRVMSLPMALPLISEAFPTLSGLYIQKSGAAPRLRFLLLDTLVVLRNGPKKEQETFALNPVLAKITEAEECLILGRPGELHLGVKSKR
ncbi:hypothetical protein FA13DRAFT_1711522 [Coprinellus micaceus]|uniref:F-box domain-containing protein n=1 Tax=Coprinellus micaceus TaxID=71717 RepID=A0A4Y7T4E8_COPMI|nr:hypothetical protein FA13DRAFT_1711522 [Coprinellus micaceus]